jgi:nucleoside-diphosphate-sugar epimerase
MVKVLITGATGTIGSALLEHFIKNGSEVLFPTRSLAKAQSLVDKYGPNLTLFELDPSADYQGQLYQAAKGFEYIIHTSFFEFGKSDELEVQAINGLLEAARETSATRTVAFIYTTGCLVQGLTDHVAGEDEATSDNSIDLAKPRVPHENLVLNANTETLHTSVIRPPGIYGGGGVIDIYLKGVKATGKLIIPQGNSRNSLISIQDLVEFYQLILENKGSGPFTPTEPEYPSVDEFVEVAKKITGVDVVERIDNPFAALQTHGFGVFLLSVNFTLDSKRARELYGYEAKHRFLRDAETLIKLD